MRGSECFYRRFPRLMFRLRKLVRANYEPEMKLLDILCSREALSVDVGAKVGMYTYRLLRHSAEVLAFEPLPLYAAMLEKVFDGRCRIERAALSDRRAEAELRMPYTADGAAEFGRATVEPANPLAQGDLGRIDTESVALERLDDYELPTLGFIKVDVEGHELAVLRGASESIATHRPNLIVEANDDHRDGAIAELSGWLDEQGYRGFSVVRGALVPIASFDFESDYCEEAGYGPNFICFHRSRRGLEDRVRQRVAASSP